MSHAVRGFFRLAGYYRKFIKDYEAIMAALVAPLRKEGFLWTEDAPLAFQALKTAITSASVLVLPDFDQPFIM